MTLGKKIRLGDLLVANNIITPEQLNLALEQQTKQGKKLGQTLIDMGLIEENDLLAFLSKQLNIPSLDIAKHSVDPDIAKELSENLARRFRVLVLESNADEVVLAMADPANLIGLDELSHVLKKRIHPIVVKELALLEAIDLAYRHTDEINHLAEQLDNELAQNDIDFSSLISSADINEAPVVKLLQSLFEDAVLMNASDIHIEPDETVLRIRQRIDGVLNEQVIHESRIANALVMRLKLIAGMDISEKRLPQDGRCSLRIKGNQLDIRLSTLPVQYGESVVMRILDQTNGLLNLDQLGIPEPLLKRFRQLIHLPYGLILVTGPTGSGKTTTLYAAINEINQPQNKIITIEDPVEYHLPRINQVQINEKIGLTFAKVLKSALRQDPNILLVGEIRDKETANLALRASITGHLVFSTLHTNNAVDTATRFLDMGAEGFLVASSIRAIIAQRLLRQLCHNCKTPQSLDPDQINWLENQLSTSLSHADFYIGQGCQQCHQTGYQGRTGVYELLEMSPEMIEALRKSDPAYFNQAALQAPRYRNYSQSALDLALAGITSLDEVIKMAGLPG
ncbi:MAG: GspE/PulE family protein [Methylococcaceae bacterium]